MGDVWSGQLHEVKSGLSRPDSNERGSLLLEWVNQYCGMMSEELENLFELTNGLKLYEIMQKVSSTVFSDYENLNENPSIWVLKKSNLTSLLHSMNEFGISSLRGDQSFDLSEIVDVTKISKWTEDEEAEALSEKSSEGKDALLTLVEYALTMCVLSGSSEILDGLRRLPKSDQHTLSAIVKRIMTRHRFNKLRSYLSVHSLAVAASASMRSEATDLANDSFLVSDTPRSSLVMREASTHRVSIMFGDEVPSASVRADDDHSHHHLASSQHYRMSISGPDNESLRGELSALKNSVRDLTRDLEVKTQEVLIYQSEVESLRTQNEQYKEHFTDTNARGFSEKERHLIQVLGEAEEKVRHLENEVEDTKCTNAAMKENLNNAVFERDQLQLQLSKVKTVSTRTDEVRHSLASQNRELEQKLKSTIFSEGELKATIRQLKDEKEALELGQTARMQDEDAFMDVADLEASVHDKKVLMMEVERLKGELNLMSLENNLLRSKVGDDSVDTDFESTTRGFHHTRMDTLVAHGGLSSPTPANGEEILVEDGFSVSRRLEDSRDPSFASFNPHGRGEFRNEYVPPPTVEGLHEIVANGLGTKSLATVFLFADGGHSVACGDAELKPKLEVAVTGWRDKLDDPPVLQTHVNRNERQGKADAKGGCAEGCTMM